MTQVLIILVVLTIGAIFTAVAWFAYRERRWRLLAGAWVGCAALQGYVSYRLVCSQPLTCDVGDVADFFPRLWPRFTFAGGVAFGAAVLAVAVLHRAAPTERLRPGLLLVGSLAVVGAWALAGGLVATYWAW